jgi:hypothetical protein
MAAEHAIGILPPIAGVQVFQLKDFRLPGGAKLGSVAVVLEFVDASGTPWSRDDKGRLRQLGSFIELEISSDRARSDGLER